jgi:mono/diheme cytochrome c family protein
MTDVRNHKATKPQRKTFLTSVFFVSLCLCGFLAAAPVQQTTPKKIWDGIYTPEQAKRGKAEFDQTCSRCHNLALIGSERGPAIKGSAFLSHWDKGSVADLFIKIRDTMPEGGPGTLNEDTKIDILSYILQQNGFPAGTEELKKDLPSLEDIRLAKRGIWDGVFTAEQAGRGKTALLQNGCNGCHGPELAGDRGPSLKGERFIGAWENGSLNRLFVKLRDTMPPLNAEQVSPNTKIDIIAYLLQVNGFPSGSAELGLDTDALESLQIVRKGADNGVAPNFALVQVLGCLTQNPDGRWVLSNSTEPSSTKDETASPAGLKTAEARPLGTQTFELVSVTGSFQAESHKGHKMEARGLLYREPNHAELNLTSLAMIAPTCGK